MNRRDAFKLFAAGAVSLLGMKGLAEALSRPKASPINSDVFTTLQPVMGEQAHWPEVPGAVKRVQILFKDNLDVLTDAEIDETFGRAARDLQWKSRIRREKLPEEFRAKVVAAKIDGRWIDTSTWTPEQIEAIQPGVLKQSPGWKQT